MKLGEPWTYTKKQEFKDITILLLLAVAMGLCLGFLIR